MKNYRSEVNKNIPLYEKYKLNLKNFFLNLNIVKLTKNFLRQNFYISKNEYIQRNFKSIKNLINKYNDSIIFIQLKNKNEIIFGKEYDTYYAENYIKELSNNHHVCNFENNISNFYEIDMHPNKRGYESLFNCVNMVLKNHFK